MAIHHPGLAEAQGLARQGQLKKFALMIVHV